MWRCRSGRSDHHVSRHWKMPRKTLVIWMRELFSLHNCVSTLWAPPLLAESTNKSGQCPDDRKHCPVDILPHKWWNGRILPNTTNWHLLLSVCWKEVLTQRDLVMPPPQKGPLFFIRGYAGKDDLLGYRGCWRGLDDSSHCLIVCSWMWEFISCKACEWDNVAGGAKDFSTY